MRKISKCNKMCFYNLVYSASCGIKNKQSGLTQSLPGGSGAEFPGPASWPDLTLGMKMFIARPGAPPAWAAVVLGDLTCVPRHLTYITRMCTHVYA